MAISIGSNGPSAIFAGSQPVSAVYVGATQVWPVGGWTPQNILSDLSLWLDADDAGSINDAAGGVSAWVDKSPNAFFARQLSAGLRPTYDAPGRRIVFANTHWLQISSYARPAPITYFLVMAMDVTEREVALSEGGTVLTRHAFGNAPGDFARFQTVAGSQITVQGTIPAGEHIAAFALSNTAGFVAVNGVDQTTDTQTGQATASRLQIGSSVGSSALGLNGHIREIVAVDGVTSVADRQRMEGYLAHKWGLAGDLPAAHPFKSAPP